MHVFELILLGAWLIIVLVTLKFRGIGETLPDSWRQVVLRWLISLQIVYALINILSLVIRRHGTFVLVIIYTHLNISTVTGGYAILL